VSLYLFITNLLLFQLHIVSSIIEGLWPVCSEIKVCFSLIASGMISLKAFFHHKHHETASKWNKISRNERFAITPKNPPIHTEQGWPAYIYHWKSIGRETFLVHENNGIVYRCWIVFNQATQSNAKILWATDIMTWTGETITSWSYRHAKI
jgi:hypothetical protein